MNSARLVVHSGIALALAGNLAACTSEPAGGSPLRPSSPLAITSLEIQGPGTVPPGSTARFTVTARLSDGVSRDVTDETVWHSSSPSVLSIDGTGLATAHARGETHLSANYLSRLSTREVIVVPAGSYRLTGQVTESDASDAVLVDALVEVTAGSGAGLSTATGTDGRYRLYGVAGDTQIRVTKEGFQPRVLSVAVADHQTQNVELSLVRPREDVSGAYTLTITAVGDCRQALPEEVRTRTYTARLTQNGPNVEARLSGANFAVSPGGRGDRFRGKVEPDGVTFSLSSYIYKYYGYTQYPDVIESLPAEVAARLSSPSAYFVLDGSVVARGSRSHLSGTLAGAFQIFKHDPRWGAFPATECRGGHQFALSRIGE